MGRCLGINYHHHHPPPPPPPEDPSFSHQPPSSALITRDYRKGNWTLQETLILITAKHLDDDRRARASSPSAAAASSSGHRPAELRWKWVENYCWKNGCFRSQNQCNDKWDNLLRDYKKVRDYQARSSGNGDDAGRQTPYWSLEKYDRKERNLPSNLASEVFDALTEVLSRRNAHRSSTVSAGSPPPLQLLPQPPPLNFRPPLSPPDPPAPAVQQMPVSGTVEAVAAEMSPEQSTSSGGAAEEREAKKRRRRGKGFGPSLAHGVSVLAETLLACEEKREKRHSERIALEERRLCLEVQRAERAELQRHGVSSLVSAVNNLSAAIHSLATTQHHTHP
ncbi:hypothetical protein KSP39_PZI012923 [Platanthera zijinensis]|uniref:Myb-like domain-containing protein n=1 Tax=Platanthera zijinensis TaxID=2320716 RepID=A0AAP0BCX7_9ASPA